MDVYAFKNIDIEKSASGGAFPTIVQALQRLCSEKVIVYGAAFGNHFCVEHIRVENSSGIARLQGSKYVQSMLGDSLANIVSDLINGNRVLFTGTPCQVAAVKNYVTSKVKDTSKLFLLDIICHGTPKQEIWSDFIIWLEREYNSKLVDFSFRHQKGEWTDYPVMAKFKDGKQIMDGYKIRLFTNLFGAGLIMNEYCYRCEFSNLKRLSDLTIGDFWGIKEVMPDFPYRDRVSEVLVNSEKGNEVIRNVKEMSKVNRRIIITQCYTSEYLKYQHNLNKPTKKPNTADELWIDYNINGIEYVLKKYAGNNVIDIFKHYVRRLIGN